MLRPCAHTLWNAPWKMAKKTPVVNAPCSGFAPPATPLTRLKATPDPNAAIILRGFLPSESCKVGWQQSHTQPGNRSHEPVSRRLVCVHVSRSPPA